MFRHAGLILPVAVFAAFLGCAEPAVDDPGVTADLIIAPSPPVVGDAELTLKLTSADGEPLAGADVDVEGNMNHAGMKPSFAKLKETAPGEYVGTLEFTMGGDWYVLVTAKTADGMTIERKIDVEGVQTR
jgi:hypothetical protein